MRQEVVQSIVDRYFVVIRYHSTIEIPSYIRD